MDQTKDVNFTNVPSNRRATFLHGPMRTDQIHHLPEDLEPMVHQHLDPAFRIHLARMDGMRANQVGNSVSRIKLIV